MGWAVPALFITGLVTGATAFIVDRGFQYYADLSSQLFAQKFPELAALAKISREESKLLSPEVQEDRIQAINALQAFSHAFTSAQIADDFEASLGSEEANNFARFIGDSLEALTHNTPTAFNIGDQERDLWNNDYGLNNLVGKTMQEKVDTIAVQINSYLESKPTDMKFEWDMTVDSRKLSDENYTTVSKEALSELHLLDPFFGELRTSFQLGIEDLYNLDSLQVEKVINSLSIPQSFSDLLTNFQVVRRTSDPFIVDLDGNGFSEAVFHNVYYDIDGDGMAELLNHWAARGDGFLVQDIDGDGQIKGVEEIYGNDTAGAWVQLGAQDDNGDNVINVLDAVWSNLRIWQDKNSDGYTQGDELFTLDALGYTGINLLSHATNPGAITTVGGNVQISAVGFTFNDQNTRYDGDVAMKFETLFLPELRGFSGLTDLRIGASIDAALLTQVQALAVRSAFDVFDDFTLFQNDFTNLMFRWAGVQDIAADSRGNFISDARILEFLEVYFGQGFFQARFPEPDPLSLAALQIENVFEDVRDAMMAKFIFQSGGDVLFDAAGRYDLASDNIVFDLAPVLSVDGLNALGTEGALASDALAYWAAIAFYLDGVRGNLDGFSASELAALNAAVALSDASLTWADVLAARFDTADLNFDGDASNDFFAGGTGDDILNGNEGNDTLQGNAGNDIITGGIGDDTLDGGAGADFLQGGEGADTLRDGLDSDLLQGGLGDDIYVWGGGAADVIADDGGYDVLRIGEATLNNVFFERVFGDDLVIRIGLNTITLQDQLADPALGGEKIEELQSLDGTILLDLTTLDVAVKSVGTAGDDTIIGIEYVTTGKDSIWGGDGNDILIGGLGDDSLFGENGNDILRGGFGNDSLYAGTGNDELYGGDGNDYLNANVTNPGSNILSGGAGDDVLVSSKNRDILDAGLGNDTVIGGLGASDIFIYSGGNDVYQDFFKLNLNARIEVSNAFTFANATFIRPSSNNFQDLLIRFDDQNSITLGGFFSDANSDAYWGQQDLIFTDGSATIELRNIVFDTVGSEDDDIIGTISWNIAENIQAGDGDDTINVVNSTQTIGHIINGGIGSDTVTYNTIHYNAGIQVDLESGTAQSYIISSGSLSGVADTLVSIENVTGHWYDDILLGNSSNNILDGSFGGNDILEGRGGDDTYVLGSGQDIITDTAGIDTISIASSFFSTLSFSQDNNDLLLTHSNGETRVVDFFGLNAIEFIKYDDTSADNNDVLMAADTVLDWVFGTSAVDIIDGTINNDVIYAYNGYDTVNGFGGDDTLFVTSANNVISGGDGNDTLSGGWSSTYYGDAGDDIIYGAGYLYGGDGNDTLEGIGYLYGDAGNDIITGSMVNDVIYGGNDNDVIYNGGGSGSVSDTLLGQAGDDTFIISGNGKSTIIGEDGYDIVDYSDLTQSINYVADSSNNTRARISYGTNLTTRDTLNTIEEVRGTEFNDTFRGNNTASEKLYGGSGNDTFDMRGGTDQLFGQSGNDEYRFNSAYNFTTTLLDIEGIADVIFLTDVSGINDLIITDVGNDTVITFTNGSASSITILNQNAGSGIEYLEFNDGTRIELVAPPPNILPVAQDDLFEGTETVPLSGNVLVDNGNGADSDIDGVSLTVTAGTLTTLNGGTVVLQENGDFDYHPANGFSGIDSFAYTLIDERGGTATANVTLNIVPLQDHAPLAENDLFTSERNLELIGNVLADNGNGADSEIDAQSMSVVAFEAGTTQGGFVTVNADGNFSYLPRNGFIGQDSFSYTLLDENGNSDRAIVFITVETENVAPVTGDDIFTIQNDDILSGNLLVDNGNGADSDPEGDTLTILAETRVTENSGTVVIQENGDFIYTPNSAFAGEDRFYYIVFDNNGNASSGRAIISVIDNTAPVAVDDIVVTNEDTAVV
ncbi:MAG: Ig-like domain-containing protein, partial [Alphaproteobacteria bacterium]|nr:Ig-like domain-containing protein [Alphaproteobacteria bacterium]